MTAHVTMSHDLPTISHGFLYPIAKRDYVTRGTQKFAIYYGPDGFAPLTLRVKGKSREVNRMGSFITDTGHLLLHRGVSAKNRTYPVYKHDDGVVEIHVEHELYPHLHEFPYRYALSYDQCRWVDRKFYELACHFFGAPKDWRYRQYIVGTPDVYHQYAECFSEVSDRTHRARSIPT